MKNLIQNNIMIFYTKKIWVVITIFSMYVASLRQTAGNYDLSYWEFVLTTLTDHYYILYFMVLSYLFFLFPLLDNQMESLLLRVKFYGKYFMIQGVSVAIISTLFVALHGLIVAIMGLGLRLERNIFSTGNDYQEIYQQLPVLGQTFSTPLLAIFSCIVYLIIGLSFIGILSFFVANYLDKRLVVVFIITAYFFMIMGLRVDLDEKFPFLFLNNFLILHHALGVGKYATLWILLWEFLLLGLMIFIIKKYWYKRLQWNMRVEGLHQWYKLMLFSRKNLAITLLYLVLTTFFQIVKHKGMLTGNDLLIEQFWGHGIGYFYLLQFLNMLLYNGVPIYILCWFLVEEEIGRTMSVNIRIGSRKRWAKSIFYCGLSFIRFYILISLVVNFLVAILNGLSFNHYKVWKDLFIGNGVTPMGIVTLITIIMISKILELNFQFLLVWIFFLYSKKMTLSFIFIECLYGLIFIPFGIMKYSPIGLSSLSRLELFSGVGGSSLLTAFTILFISNIGCILLIKKKISSKILIGVNENG